MSFTVQIVKPIEAVILGFLYKIDEHLLDVVPGGLRSAAVFLFPVHPVCDVDHHPCLVLTVIQKCCDVGDQQEKRSIRSTAGEKRYFYFVVKS